MRKFKDGETVMLKSGGPVMTIKRQSWFNEKEYLCIYMTRFVDSWNKYEDCFHEDLLIQTTKVDIFYE